MKNNLLFSAFIFGILVSVLSGCSQSTKIVSEPSGANVYINGRLKGKTPLKYTTTISNHGEIQVSLSHPGHFSLDTILRKDGKTDKFLRIMGYIFVVPLDYDKKFKPAYVYNLNPKVQSANQNISVNEPDEYNGENQLNPSKIEKLKKLRIALNEGLITRNQYISLKKDIIEGKE